MNRHILLLILLLLPLSGCHRSRNSAPVEPHCLVFMGSIKGSPNYSDALRRFDVNDQIGLYARGAVLHDNLNYFSTRGGDPALFFPMSKEDEIYLNCSCEQADFFAYAPYQHNISGTQVPVDLVVNPVDLLYAQKRAVEGDPKEYRHALTFEHVLSRIIFTVVNAPEGLSVTSMTLRGVPTRGFLDVLTGQLLLPEQTVVDLPITIFEDGLRASAIILPANILNGELTLTLSDGSTHSFSYDKLYIERGLLYLFNIVFDNSGRPSIDWVNGTILDWNEMDGGELPINPNNEEPAPTPAPIPNGTLLFAGSDFDNWNAFLAGLNKYGVQSYVSQAVGDGRNGTAALHINGTGANNDYVFTANHTGADFTGKKKISLYIKGTAGKSLSMNLYLVNGTYAVFNLDDVGEDGHVVSISDAPIVLRPAPLNDKGNGTNSYAKGAIDTDGQWLKVTLDISTLELAKSNSIFALKLGKGVPYDLYVDDITIE